MSPGTSPAGQSPTALTRYSVADAVVACAVVA